MRRTREEAFGRERGRRGVACLKEKKAKKERTHARARSID